MKCYKIISNKNFKLKEELIHLLIKKKSVNINRQLAKLDYLSSTIESELSDDKDNYVRGSIARKTRNKHIQIKLSKDKNVGVKSNLSKNNNLYNEPQDNLVNADSIYIKANLYYNHKLTKKNKLKLEPYKEKIVRLNSAFLLIFGR